jgi:hypothetical protein
MAILGGSAQLSQGQERCPQRQLGSVLDWPWAGSVGSTTAIRRKRSFDRSTRNRSSVTVLTVNDPDMRHSLCVGILIAKVKTFRLLRKGEPVTAILRYNEGGIECVDPSPAPDFAR